jgi:hypothetical protein
MSSPYGPEISVKHLLIKLGRVATAIIVVLVLSCLPVIPVMESPVVPNPIERSRWLCGLQLYVSPMLVGVRHRMTSMTLISVIALGIAAWFVTRSLNRLLFGRLHKPTSH